MARLVVSECISLDGVVQAPGGEPGPIVLGSGTRPFDDVADAVTLKLVDAHPPGNGAVILTYHRAQP